MTTLDPGVCIGPDAGQLIGFLCSLGALETATTALPEHQVRLGFTWERFAFRPVLDIEPRIGRNELLARMQKCLLRRGGLPPLTELGENLPCDPADFEKLAKRLTSEADLESLAFIAAFGVSSPESKDKLLDTAFRTMSGAGHQKLLTFARKLAQETTSGHLEHALFERWSYTDPELSLRFDSTDDRRYALRAKNPSGAPTLTERGANALAFQALAMLPVIPVGGKAKAETTLAERKPGGAAITWRLWERPITSDVVASILALPAKHEHYGGLAAYTVHRIMNGKFRSFTPSRRLW